MIRDNNWVIAFGALVLLIAVYFGYQTILSTEYKGGMWGLGLIVFGGGGAYLVSDKPKANDSE